MPAGRQGGETLVALLVVIPTPTASKWWQDPQRGPTRALAAAAAVMVLVVEGPKVATRAPASAWAAPTLVVVVVVVASPRFRWAVHPRSWDIRRSITCLSPIQRRRRSQCSLSRVPSLFEPTRPIDPRVLSEESSGHSPTTRRRARALWRALSPKARCGNPDGVAREVCRQRETDAFFVVDPRGPTRPPLERGGVWVSVLAPVKRGVRRLRGKVFRMIRKYHER